MDQDNCPFYIGKGRDHKGGFKRWRPQTHKIGHTYNKIKSIGIANVKVYFLHKDISETEAFKWERYWIKYLGRRDNGTGQLTNHTDGGEGQSGRSPWNKGKKMSEETKQKISKTLEGREFSEEACQKMSDSRKGKLPSLNAINAAQKANMGNTYRKGSKHSEESKQKMSLSKMGNQNWCGNK